MGDCLQTGKRFPYVTNHLGQLSLPSLWGRFMEYHPIWLMLGGELSPMVAVCSRSASRALSRSLWLVVIVYFSCRKPMRVCLLWVASCDLLLLCVTVCGDQWEFVCSRWRSSRYAVSSICLRGTNRSQWKTPDAQCFLQGLSRLMHLQSITNAVDVLSLWVWWQERRLACKKYSHNNCHKFTFGRFGYQPNVGYNKIKVKCSPNGPFGADFRFLHLQLLILENGLVEPKWSVWCGRFNMAVVVILDVRNCCLCPALLQWRSESGAEGAIGKGW